MTKENNINLALNSISDTASSKRKKRVGRGIGSGLGKTAGRGHKGQKSRSGFEGGQMPLQQRLPKFGFSSRVNNDFQEINIKSLEGMKTVSIDTLKEKKLINKNVKKVKIFGNYEINTKLTIEGIKLSNGAKASVEKAGGKIK